MLLYIVALHSAGQEYLKLKLHKLNPHQFFKVALPLWFKH
jgi:hypothetical protein